MENVSPKQTEAAEIESTETDIVEERLTIEVPTEVQIRAGLPPCVYERAVA